MFNPFLPLAAVFSAGVRTGLAVRVPAAVWEIPAVVALILAWLFFARRRKAATAACALTACALIGAALAGRAEADFAGHPLRSLQAGTAVELTGTLVRTPSAGLDFDQLLLRAERVEAAGRVIRTRGRARITIPRTPYSARLRDYRIGDRLRLSAAVLAPREYANFGPSFSDRYLRTQRLHLLASVKSGLLVERLDSAPGWAPGRRLSALRRALLDAVDAGFADPDAPGGIRREGTVLEALLLGERGRMGEELTRSLQKTGLFHLIAISGAHIGIITVFLFAAFRACRVADRVSSAILIGLLLFYGLLVEGRASVVRAVVMAVLYLAGRLLWKDVGLLNTLSLSALLILLADPFQILDQGFALTYAATLGLLLFAPPMLRRLPRLPLKLSETAALSLSAQIGVLPLTTAAFHRVALSAIPLNFIAVPLVGILMAAGYVLLPLGLLGPWAARLGAAVLGPLADVFIRSLGLLDGLPFLSYRVPTPPFWTAWIYAASYLALLAPDRPRLRRAAATMAVLSTLLVLFVPFPPRGEGLRVTILDVGQGDSILVELPGGEAMLIDGGGAAFGTFDVGENVVSPALWDRRLRRIAVLVLTHDHPDHRRGLLAVARNFRVREFWEPPGGKPDEESAALEGALAGSARWKIPAGTVRRIGDVTVEALSPAGDTGGAAADENDRSLVLRLTYGRTRFLLTGDIGAGVEAKLVRAGVDLRAEVLKAPHHGSRTSSSPALLEATAPRFVVVTAGSGNRYGLPHPEVVARLEATGARVLRTDRDGAVELCSDGVDLAVRWARKR